MDTTTTPCVDKDEENVAPPKKQEIVDDAVENKVEDAVEEQVEEEKEIVVKEEELEEEEDVEKEKQIVEKKKKEEKSDSKQETNEKNKKEIEKLKRRIETLEENLKKSESERKNIFSTNSFLKENNARLESKIQSLEQNKNIASIQDLKGRTTEKLVKLSEKNYHLAQKLKISKRDLEKRDQELAQTRQSLLEKLVGNSPCTPGEHVPILELFNLYVQSVEQSAVTSAVPTKTEPVNSLQIESLRQTIEELKKHNRTLTSQIEKMNERVKQANEKEEKIDQYSMMSKSFSDKLGREKTMRSRAEREVTVANEKIVKLSEHIEKLMVHLKHESTSKMKVQKTANRLEREVKSLTSRTSVLSRKNAERERIIAQLREGSKILEDQLRLMDKKYIELRSKLDWTRSHSKAVVKKMQKEANELRAKWALAGGLDMELSSTKKRKKKNNKKGKKSPQDEDEIDTKKEGGVKLPPCSPKNMKEQQQQQQKDDDKSLPWSSHKIGQLTRELGGGGV